MKVISHVTSIDGKKFTSPLKVGEDYADWLEVVKARGLNEETAEAVLCKYILDSVKLEQNARVRGPVMKSILANREVAQTYATKNDLDGFVAACQTSQREEYLDQLGNQLTTTIPGWKPLQ